MKTVIYLFIAILGNALGTALMAQTSLGMTAWGSAAANTAHLFQITIGQAFVVLSIFFYLIATILRRRVHVKELIESTIFLLSFGLLSDAFISLLPDMSTLHFFLRLLINIVGMLVLLFSIAVHIKLHRFVHPMDVYLSVLQQQLSSVSKGTYIAYVSGFAVGIITGLLFGEITDIGVGTVLTLLTSGFVMKRYNKYILEHWVFD